MYIYTYMQGCVFAQVVLFRFIMQQNSSGYERLQVVEKHRKQNTSVNAHICKRKHEIQLKFNKIKEVCRARRLRITSNNVY